MMFFISSERISFVYLLTGFTLQTKSWNELVLRQSGILFFILFSTDIYVHLLLSDSRAVHKYALFESFVRSRSTSVGNRIAEYCFDKNVKGERR
jgi:hypothetical protein